MHALKKSGMKSAVWCYAHLNTGCSLILEASLYSAWSLTALQNSQLVIASLCGTLTTANAGHATAGRESFIQIAESALTMNLLSLCHEFSIDDVSCQSSPVLERTAS